MKIIMDAVTLNRVEKTYETGAGKFNALRPLDLKFQKGELVGIIGPSGSGKSTLLNLVSGIDRPSKGTVSVIGEKLHDLSESRLATFRGKTIGIVFQFFQLIPTLTVLENVMLAMDLVKIIPGKERKARALGLLDQVGVKAHSGKVPSKLSGGEQQRVAIARALANDPSILVADEPTGNLDSENSKKIMKIFKECAAEGRLVMIATHETGHFNYFSRVISLADGQLTKDVPGKGASANV